MSVMRTDQCSISTGLILEQVKLSARDPRSPWNLPGRLGDQVPGLSSAHLYQPVRGKDPEIFILNHLILI